MPVAYAKQWPAVAAQALTANGGADGLITIAKTDGFFVGQIVTLANNDPATEFFQVVEVPSPTTLYVSSLSNLGDKRHKANASSAAAYTVAKASTIAAVQQNKRISPPTTLMQDVFAAEPITALRNMLVDSYGQPLNNKGDLQTLRSSTIMTTSYVNTNGLDIRGCNTVVLFIDVTKGSATGAFVRFYSSDDNATFYPVEVDAGTPSVTGDESRATLTPRVHALSPSGSGSTQFSRVLRLDQGHALGKWLRCSVISNGADPTGSLCAIKAYAFWG